MSILDKAHNETLMDYKIRLCENKDQLHLTWSEIAQLVNGVTKQEYGESAIRKWYTAFDEGRKYVYNKEFSSVRTRILCISDLHVPYQLPVSTFEQYRGKVELLVLNGDIVDMSSISKFDKIYRNSPMEEIIAAREYIMRLNDYLKPEKILVNYGNHDIRFERYLSKAMDTDLNELMPKTPLELIIEQGFIHYDKKNCTKTQYSPLRDYMNIEYTNNWFCQYGDTIFVHPTAFSSGILKTAEKALYYFRNEGYDFRSLVMAHTHRLGEYVIGNTTIYEQGCCCNVDQMQYNNGKLINSQKEGFLYLCQDMENKTIRDKTKLILIK